MAFELSNLNKLSEVKKPKDIKSLSKALFPGTHCPLFGATMSCIEIEGLQSIIVGNDECTYYSQAFACDRKGINNNIWSYSMEHNDVIFGGAEKLAEAIRYIYIRTKAQAIMLVTTCIPEITGEDYDSLALSLELELNIPIMVVHTEHFKCNSHISGIERTLTALGRVMKKQEVDEKSINILGHRFGGLEETELFKLLQKNEFKINMKIPSTNSIENISKAPAAKLNIVTDFTALGLAKLMKEKFNVPYVIFDKNLSKSRIDAAYDELQLLLNIKISSEVLNNKKVLDEKIKEGIEKLQNKTFIYGNSPLMAFEVSSFLTDLKMTPIIIQARDLYPNDDVYIAEILAKNIDPYVSSIANIAPLKTLYPILKPNFYIGHENPMNLIKNQVLQVIFDSSAAKLGYELPIEIINQLIKTLDTKENPMLALMGGR